MTADALDRDDWERLLNELDLATPAAVIDAIAEARDLSPDRADRVLKDAVATGALVEDPDAGTYGEIRLANAENTPPEGGFPGANPTPGDDASRSTDADYDAVDDAPGIESGVLPEDLKAVDQWLTWKETDDGRKVPRAPYEHPDWPDKFVSAQDPEVWVSVETAAKWADTLSGYGLAFNIRDREEYPGEEYVLVDYDDARDPETREIHPTVREHLERADSYADVSASGTGVHIFLRGSLPQDVKAIEAPLPDCEAFPDAEIEVYDSARYSAMTGDHIQGTPTETRECQAFLEDLAEEFATVAEGTPDELLRDPETPKEHLADVDTTADMQDVLDAIQHAGPRDVRLRSPVTHERGDGSKSLDPSWADSKSGTRLAQVGDGWVYRQGMIGLDALQVVALEDRIITDERAYPSGSDFWNAVDALRDRGAHIPKYEPPESDTEHRALLPTAHQDLAAAASGWDWKHAARQGEDTLTVEDARERTKDAIADAYETGDRVLVEALPTMGKSYGATTAAAATGEPTTILTGRGREEQYDQYAEWCEEHGLRYKRLPSFTHDCPTAAGDHGEEWRETVMDWYRRGATPQQIHNQAGYVLDRPLPCQVAEDGSEIDCGYRHAWDFDPDEYDVLIGHYTHAYTQQATESRTVVFDEFPDAYETELHHDLQAAVSYWLEATDGVPFESYTDLVENRDDDRRRADALLWFEEHGVEPDETHVFDDASAHAAAPLAVFTLLTTGDLGNGWERADLDDAGTGLFTDGRDYRDKEARVFILQPPALKYASGIVALDGTPTQGMWENALGERLNHRPVLQDAEREEYLTDALNLNLVRTTEYLKPYNNADYVNVDRDRALLEKLVETHDERPGVITTATARDEYDDAGLLELERDEFGTPTGGVIDGPVDRIKWHGNVLGSNEFTEKRLGAVIGSNHYGDGYIKKWGAYAREAVERGDGKGDDLFYTGIGEDVLQHMREHDTLQAAMRFGRDGNGAVVYAHTNTLPEWIDPDDPDDDGILAGQGRVLSTRSDGERQVLDAIEGLEKWRTAEIAAHPAVDVGERQVFNILTDFADRGALGRELDGRGYTWRDEGLHEVNDHGEVDLDAVDLEALGEEPVEEIARNTYYTLNFRNRQGTEGDEAGSGVVPGANAAEQRANGGDPALHNTG